MDTSRRSYISVDNQGLTIHSTKGIIRKLRQQTLHNSLMVAVGLLFYMEAGCG
jgi:hypothetical protein